MSTTVKHVGSNRVWEGSLYQWEKHSEYIIYWCDGGEVETEALGDCWFPVKGGNFGANFKYRKQQRTPKAGEVWCVDDRVWVRAIDEIEGFDGWFLADGSLVDFDSGIGSLKFIASSLGEYYSK